MSVWDDIVGQEPAVEVLRTAVAEPGAMTHAWLITGPPGSGRSNAARAFAAALECPDAGCGVCRECRTAYEGTHADVRVVSTEGLSLRVDLIRDLVAEAALRPSVGRWRVIVVEDADRLTDHAADALLKDLEEPTARTVWVLCAPSVEDVIVTIRSRVRHVRLRTPSLTAVAELLVRRDGVEPSMARFAARAAQSHIGRARWLARDEQARIRRRDTLGLATKIRTTADAVGAAADLESIAKEEAAATTAQRDGAERAHLLATLGADPGARTQPPAVRAQLTALEKEQAARAKRLVRDVVDRSLLDLLSVYRDALILSTGAGVALINEDSLDVIRPLAARHTAESLLQILDAIGVARERIAANVPPLLALEALTVGLRLPR